MSACSRSAASVLNPLRARKLSDFVILPRRATPGSAGYDLFSAVDGIIYPFHQFHCYTDIAVQLPSHCYGRIASRSGLASRGIVVQAGVIDPDFTGNVVVLLYNTTFNPYYIYQGDNLPWYLWFWKYWSLGETHDYTFKNHST